MSKPKGRAIAAVCLIIGPGAAFGQQLDEGTVENTAPPLRANPFSRPSFTLELEATPQASLVAPRVALELRATMVSGDTALVNIDGAILSTGEEYAGYRVLSISEGRAVLSDGSERLVLNVYEKQLGLDEDNDIGAGR